MPRTLKKRLAASVLLPAALIQMLVLTAPAFAQDYDSSGGSDISQTQSLLARDTPERKPGQKPDPNSLEGGIWVATAKAEVKAKTSGERDLNPELDAYVGSVLTRITGPYSGDVRLYVMDRPFFNASMAPNGYTEVWTGLLLRCETEDELAFVLGHESGHFRHSHSIKTYQAAKDSSNAAMVASMLLAVAAMGASMNASSVQAAQNISNITSGLIDIVYLGAVAAFLSYSRETEAQADAYGLIYMRQAGYFPGAAADVWQGRLDETAASDIDKVRRSPARINVFGDHPLETDRLVALRAQDKAANKGVASTRTPEEARAARAAYRAHIRPYLSAWLKDDLRRQDYGQTLFVINRLSVDGLDAGVLNFYAGEAYRLRSKGDNSGDLDKAVAAYQLALKSPDAPKETWRQLGDVFRHLGNTKAAVDAFDQYLKIAPDASDAWMVQDQRDTLAKTLPAPAAPATPAPAEPAAPAPASAASAAALQAPATPVPPAPAPTEPAAVPPAPAPTTSAAAPAAATTATSGGPTP
jgi:predicted Zn-dependent protease